MTGGQTIAESRAATDLALLLDHAGVGSGFYDCDLRCLFVNDRLAEINGLPAAAHIGKTVRDILPELSDYLEAVLQPVLVHGVAVENLEITGETPADPGMTRTWLASYYPNKSDKGDIIGFFAIVREITYELKTEGALEDAASRLSMAMSSSGFGVWDWSVDTNSVWFSDTWQTMLGYEPGEMPQHISTWQNAVHPDDWRIINAVLEPHLAGLTDHYECEHRVRCKDGSWLWILDRGKVVKRAADGRAIRMVGTHDNIQQRKEAEAQRVALLEVSRDLAELDNVSRIIDRTLRAIIDNLDVDFAAFTEARGPDGTPRMARLWRNGRFKSSTEKWVGVRVYKPLARRLMKGETVVLEDLTAQGYIDPVDTNEPTDGEDLRGLLIVPIMRHGRLVGTLFAGDRMPRKWTQQQSRFLADLRDRMREAKARAKAGEANRQAQDELQRVGRLNALSALASTLAHELNQPLSAATNYLMAARIQLKRQAAAGTPSTNHDPDTSPEHILDLAAKQVVKAGEIIRQMRAYTDSGEVMARLASVPAAIDAALETTMASMAPRGLSIRKSYASDLPDVMLDVVQFQQVVSNLLRNAIEAMERQEGPELDIRVTQADQQVTVDVCDNGPGLSEKAQESLFQPFRSAKRHGLGLGLPICRTIIEAHGGTLTGAQRAEGGARFTIMLPVPSISR